MMWNPGGVLVQLRVEGGELIEQAVGEGLVVASASPVTGWVAAACACAMATRERAIAATAT